MAAKVKRRANECRACETRRKKGLEGQCPRCATKRARESRKFTRGLALLFLKDVRERTEKYAEWLDPERKRQYEKDPLLKAMDGIASKAATALDQLDPGWRSKQ